jgi:predicted RecB family nuclease
MHLSATELLLSATDLSNFLSCPHLTALSMGVAHGKPGPPKYDDPLLQILFQRGIDHEKTYVASLQPARRQIVDLADVRDSDAAVARTRDAMRSGADVIVQGALRDGRWQGRPDLLQRVETPSALGAWSYEVSDTKLARETRAGTILQLGLYSEMLETAQGRRPEHFYVVTPAPDAPINKYRVDDYAAYFRLIRAQMEETVSQDYNVVAAANYPEPVDHCDVCAWSSQCNKKRHQDDHLSLVAGISRTQRREFESQQVTTLTALAKVPIPLPFKPKRGAADSYERVREQARVQFASRDITPPLYELRDFEEGKGLGRLPEPSPGDLFLDLEGDLFAAEGGREYLFGVVTLRANAKPVYRSLWAFTEHDERQAFESVMDLIMQARHANPGMHVYHYAPYEPGAFKRLMGRYATREEELDALLRAGTFVDLYAVVRQGVRAGVERYSIKNLEVFYGFERAVPLAVANRNLPVMQQALELGCPETVPVEVRAVVEGYNKDDCLSTLHLRTWLERLRAEWESKGTPVPRPMPKEGEAPEEIDARAQRVAALRARLLEGAPDVPADQTKEQHARWLLAYLLDFHRREDKAGWWEYYRLCDLPEEDLFDEPQAIAGLGHLKRIGQVLGKTGKPTRSVIDRYQYQIQEMEIRTNDELKLQDGKKFGDVVQVDRIALTIDVQKGPSQVNNHPTAVFAHRHINPKVLEDAICAIGEHVAGGKLDPVARSLLLALPPRLSSEQFAPPSDNVADYAVRIVGDLDHTVLAIQGPPGSGKTFNGARMICSLVKEGKKVGVTGPSHKVIRNLLDAVAKEANATGVSVLLGHKRDADEEDGDGSRVKAFGDNPDALRAIQYGEVHLLGGTAWLWARPEFANSVDVLFVDEAGQMSLANSLAVSHAAQAIVLLGDPQQLDQPQKGSHPDGVNASALEHMLGEHKTIPLDRGLFLPITWRLAPSICAFTSELFYDGKLRSKPGLENQRLTGSGDFDGSGLWVVEVDHDGNRNSSTEEVEAVAGLAARLTAPGARWIDELGKEKRITGQDILVVSPYNAHVSRLAERLASTGARVGTVDKFQGQEAPVVIYSMATSRPEDAPRGMEFLYSLNRLNVATSRAKCAVFLVASPRLFDPECRTPRQMKLANALCRYREMGRRTGRAAVG